MQAHQILPVSRSGLILKDQLSPEPDPRRTALVQIARARMSPSLCFENAFIRVLVVLALEIRHCILADDHRSAQHE
jgi:hypothetical protein